MTDSGDIAAPLLPRRRGAVLPGVHHGSATAVAFAPRELHALIVHGRGVAERHVIGIQHIFDLQLPVTVENIAVPPGIQREFAIGRAIDQIVDTGFHRANMVFESDAGPGEAGKDEPPINADARDAAERKIAFVETCGTTFRYRHVQERAVGIKGPAMIAAGEPWRVTRAQWRKFRTAMGAAVEQHFDAPVAVADHDHGLARKVGGDVIAGFWHLAGMTDKESGAAVNALHFE